MDHGFNAGDGVSARLLQGILGQRQNGCIDADTVAAIAAAQTRPLLDQYAAAFEKCVAAAAEL